MTAPATRTISGTLYTAAGAALEGKLVKIRVLPYDDASSYLREYPPSDSTPTTSIEPQEVETSNLGAWSITVPQGAVVLVEISAQGVYHAGTVPAAATATLDDLGLYRVKS